MVGHETVLSTAHTCTRHAHALCNDYNGRYGLDVLSPAGCRVIAFRAMHNLPRYAMPRFVLEQSACQAVL
jgi:hypothetical protein